MKLQKQLTALFLSLAIFLALGLTTGASPASEIQDEIDALEEQAADIAAQK